MEESQLFINYKAVQKLLIEQALKSTILVCQSGKLYRITWKLLINIIWTYSIPVFWAASLSFLYTHKLNCVYHRHLL